MARNQINLTVISNTTKGNIVFANQVSEFNNSCPNQSASLSITEDPKIAHAAKSH